MATRIAERLDTRAGHLWIHDRDDHLDHAMPRRDLIDATRRQAPRCRAACGHIVRVGRYDVARNRACQHCAELAPQPSWWRRLLGTSP